MVSDRQPSTWPVMPEQGQVRWRLDDAALNLSRTTSLLLKCVVVATHHQQEHAELMLLAALTECVLLTHTTNTSSTPC